MREGSCKHWSGILLAHGDTKCAAGVPFAAMDGDKSPGMFHRLPCHARNVRPSFDCPKRAFPTAEEVAQADAAFREYADAVIAVMEAIGKQPKGASGTVRCPRCDGTISWASSPTNGHRHAACGTPDCLQVME